jgi:hypothetical protein
MKQRSKSRAISFAKTSKKSKAITPSSIGFSLSGNSSSAGDIDTILKSRWHGAVNIRGIRYQLLYSLLRAFELYDDADGNRYLRLEGIEDLDLLGFFSENQYFQIKTADKPWNWAKLKEPVKNFLEVARSTESDRFILVVNFTPETDIEKLYRFPSLREEEREDITKKFHKLCSDVGGNIVEADNLIQRLSILPISEQQIWAQLRLKVLEAFNLEGEGVSTYLSVLIARFLDWAQERQTIGRRDLENIRIEVGEALSREQGFEAYGRGLVERVSWQVDSIPNDFLEGKGTRAGHIVANLDIPRTTWLDRIDQVFTTCKVCILKASSGQGKSTLLYRYAAERWQPDNVFAVRIVENPEQVAQICNYLQVRVDLGLPILILIDGINYQTRLWSAIVQKCSAIGVRVLITVRDEDWYRFANNSSVSYEIIKPKLELSEARQIVQILKSRNRLHNSVTSAEWAYERVGKSHLLIEYVYLLTQGRMLEERLRDQIRQFSQYQENTAKIEILRRVVLADALGTPLLLAKFFDRLNIDGDRQEILLSLEGEYLKLQGDRLTGLHWIRSTCLARILHEGYPNPASTALSILDAVPNERLSSFIANAICMDGFDVEAFLSGLADQAKEVNIETLLSHLEGIFEAGERSFFAANKHLFDEAYKAIGNSGPFSLLTEFAPTVKVNFISDMVKSLGDRAVNFKLLEDIALKVEKVSRGLDLCQKFLNRVSSTLTPEQLKTSVKHTGDLLDWCFLCQVDLLSWKLVKPDITNSDLLLSSSVDGFCAFMQGLSRYDEATYQQWMNIHRNRAIEFLKGKTDTLNLEVSAERLSVEFLVDREEASPIEQTMSRLNYLHAAFPYCAKYQAQGIWLLPFGLKPSVDDTQKNIPRENFHFQSDTSKNAIWARIALSTYLPDSCYNFEKAWHEFRTSALELVQKLSRSLKKVLTGSQVESRTIFSDNLITRLEDSIKFLPSFAAEGMETILGSIPPELDILIKENPLGIWSTSFSNFFHQLCQYIVNEDSDIGKLAVHNFKDASKHLVRMHDTFTQIFQEIPDYFDASSLNSQESWHYPILCDLLEVWLVERPKTLPIDIMAYIQSQKESKWRETLQRLITALDPLSSRIEFILPSGFYIDHPLRYLPLAFSVLDPCKPETELVLILNALRKDKYITEFFCLVPIFEGKRFTEGSFQISNDVISTLERGDLPTWEALSLRELPSGIWNYLPILQFQENPRWQFKLSIESVLSSIDSILLYTEKIQSLANPSDPWISSFHSRCQDKIHSFTKDLEILIDSSLLLLENFFCLYKTRQEYISIHDFLCHILEDIHSENFETSPTKDYFDSGQVNNAVSELLRLIT